jgi:hypothetical protein
MWGALQCSGMSPELRHNVAMSKRRERLRTKLPEFMREYGRTSDRQGMDPNDRHYDHKLEQEIKRMDPRELDSLLRDDEDE